MLFKGIKYVYNANSYMKNNTDYKIKNRTFNNKKGTIYGQLLLQNKFVYCATASANKK